MDVQQARLAVAASNLANTSTTHRADGTAYVPLEVAIHSVLDPGTGLPRPQVGPTVESSAAPTLQYEPGDPAADSRGFVHRAGNDPVGAMLTLMEISRSYEANVRAFDVSRTLMSKTLELWSAK